MDAMSSRNKSYAEPIPTDMLEDIRDKSQSHPIINRRESRNKICDIILKRVPQWKEALLSTQNMGKCLNKLFKAVVD